MTWPDGPDGAPPWLLAPRALHWIGALFSNDFVPSQWSRDALILTDYDGIVMLRRVDAEASTEIGKNRAP